MQKKKSPIRIIIIIALILAAIGGIVYYLYNNIGVTKYTEETALRKTIETYYTFTGNVEPMDSQRVVSTANLSVKKFHVKEGDKVKVGDILFDLDDRAIMSSIEQITASLEIAKINFESAQGLNKDQQTIQVNNNLASAKLSHANALNSYENAIVNHDRLRALFEADMISRTEYDAAKNSLTLAKTGLDSAALAVSAAQKAYDNLSASINNSISISREQMNQAQASFNNITRQKNDLSVKAETSGEVVEIHVTENETLIMGTRIMDIVDYDNLKIAIRVDEYDLPAVTLGKEVRVRINALDMEVAGTVDSISREAIPLGNISYFPTAVKINSDALIRVGLSAEVKLLNQRSENTVTISMKAIRFDDEGNPYVYLKDSQGKPLTTPVAVGINDTSSVEITEGVREGDILLIPQGSSVPDRPLARLRNNNR